MQPLKEIIVALSCLVSMVTTFADVHLYMVIPAPANLWTTDITVCISSDKSTCDTFLSKWYFPGKALEGITGAHRFGHVVRVEAPWQGEKKYLLIKRGDAQDAFVRNVSDMSPRGHNESQFEAWGLQFNMSIVCTSTFHGEDCRTGCVPVKERFACDEDGRKICLNGNSGSRCQTPPAALAPTPAALHDAVENNGGQHTAAVAFIAALCGFGAALALLSYRRRATRTRQHQALPLVVEQ